jgi:hypothetical protein
MKLRPVIWCVFLIAFVCASVRDVHAAGRNYGTEMSVNADVQAEFYTRYPDLADERDVVALAARGLVAERIETSDPTAAETLAARTRGLLARRSPQEWQRKAVSLFPDLGVAGSEFNTLFLRHFKEMQQTSPQFMEEPSWPVLLARRCADELRPKELKAEIVPAPASVPKTASSNPAQTPPAKRSGFWASLLNLVLLLAILIQPARWLFRCSRAFAGTDAPLTLWQRALQPAAWTYLAVALIALTRTFIANADQGFFDRFGITLLVSLLAGAVFAAPAYVVALGSMWWLRQRAPVSRVEREARPVEADSRHA